MCCTAINQNLPQFPKYGPELELVILCKDPRKDCWMRECLKCVNISKTLAGILKCSGKSKDTAVMWTQWIKNKATNRFEKGVQSGSLDNLLNYFLEILPDFLKHSFIKRSQAATFQKDNQEVENASGKVAILNIDFAESFNCDAQEEIQSAHWNQASVCDSF